MTTNGHVLPQLGGGIFLTDGGLETVLIFHDGLDLPYFAAFTLLKDEAGREALRRYYRNYAAIAKERGVGFVLDSATWRASQDWGDKLGYSADDMAEANRQSIALLQELREAYQSENTPIVINGAIGPRGDGYDPGEVMTEDQAQAYHGVQIAAFRDAGADMVSAITMTNIPEAVGITRAAQASGIPAVISFTVETDGKLPTGDSLKDAIAAVDTATGNGPAYYMVNCAHPTHFDGVLSAGESWLERIRGVRANASTLSHAELDEAKELDDGDPVELGGQFHELMARLPNLNVLGGCCGTDHRHIEHICHASMAPA
jgi:S-methylmethionine-dependent homocysteine/selenocysteine methylase